MMAGGHGMRSLIAAERARILAALPEALATADHEWSIAHERQHCSAFYVPVRPCTPADHEEWAAALAAAIEKELAEEP